MDFFSGLKLLSDCKCVHQGEPAVSNLFSPPH